VKRLDFSLLFVVALCCIMPAEEVALRRLLWAVRSKLDYAAPKQYEIGGITVTGTKYLDKKVLGAALRSFGWR
jgi:hypothetical protein